MKDQNVFNYAFLDCVDAERDGMKAAWMYLVWEVGEVCDEKMQL